MKNLLVIGLGLLVGCATTPDGNSTTQRPESWLTQFDGEDTECVRFDKIYRNDGERQASSEKSEYDVFLSELMFSRLPEGRLPDSVRLDTKSEPGQLQVTLIGETTRDLQYTANCNLGWYVLKKTRSGQYLGDGVVEKHYGQVSFFRIGKGGELLVRVVVDAQFNSMYVINSNVSTDEWFRFLPNPEE
jgi:hypothetical protein